MYVLLNYFVTHHSITTLYTLALLYCCHIIGDSILEQTLLYFTLRINFLLLCILILKL